MGFSMGLMNDSMTRREVIWTSQPAVMRTRLDDFGIKISRPSKNDVTLMKYVARPEKSSIEQLCWTTLP